MILVAGDSLDDVRPVVQQLRALSPAARVAVVTVPEAAPWSSSLEIVDAGDLRAVATAASGARVAVALGVSRPGPALSAATLAASIRCPLAILLTPAEAEAGLPSAGLIAVLARDAIGTAPLGDTTAVAVLLAGALDADEPPAAADGRAGLSRIEMEEMRAREKRLRADVARLQAELARVYRSRLWRFGMLTRTLRDVLTHPVDALKRAFGAAPPRPAVADASAAALRIAGEQRRALGERVAKSRGVVVLPPTVGWDMPLFQRPHHIARAFARLGYVAVFDCTNAGDDVETLREIEDNLFLFRGDPAQLHDLPSPMVWTFTYNYHYAEAYPRGVVPIYDWIDDLSIFPQDRAFLEASHDRALRDAPVVAAVARHLLEQLRRQRADGLYLPNAVEYERFADPRARPADDPALERFVAEGKPIAGYYGALAEWFDYEMLETVADMRPDWNFVLIGPMYDQSLSSRTLLKRSNVVWTGARDYTLLPGFLRRFDVATIPFQINEITLSTSPLKLFEYFAAGKPVVTTPMPECVAFPEVRIARTAEEFSAALDAARESGKDEDFRRRLQELGRANSWVARVDTVLDQLRTTAR